MFLPELVGKRGFIFLQNLPGCLALKEASQHKGTQREYSSKPLKHRIIKPILVVKR